MKRNNQELIINYLNYLYPNAKCELKYRSHFQLLIAVILSAQTTDERVNLVTKELFKEYGNSCKLSKASINTIERIIKPVGLYRNKAKNIIKVSEIIEKKYKGKVPKNRYELEELPGVGRKTANIILNNCFDDPTFAVDTHVSRVSRRLCIADSNDDVRTIENKLMEYFPMDKWGKLHHQFIHFGRYKCKAISPNCENCQLIKICKK